MSKTTCETYLSKFINSQNFPEIKQVLEILPAKIWHILDHRNSLPELLEYLPRKYTYKDFESSEKIGHKVWNSCGYWYRLHGRFFEATQMYLKQYYHLLKAQEVLKQRIHKGGPLYWTAESLSQLHMNSLARKYFMLTLIEDSIQSKGTINLDKTGSYHSLVWREGMDDRTFQKYARLAWDIYEIDSQAAWYPEWVLYSPKFEIEKAWFLGQPNPFESTMYWANPEFLSYLHKQLGNGTGKDLEYLSEYLLACMPGCRTYRRVVTPSTDYDIVCSMEGLEVDFRSEFGRYFICECKDWRKPIDHSSLARFCRVLQSVKCRFGIVFSKSGITGARNTHDATREQLKIFQDLGMVIVVIEDDDIKKVIDGGNFINILREKYELIRLDTAPEYIRTN